MQNKLFKKSSVERFSSPEKLNDYIQVANPSSWMVLGGALALLLGVLVWGFFGMLTEEASFPGVAQEGGLKCYVSNGVAAELEADMEVTILPMSDAAIGAVKGRVVSVAEHPLSYEEAAMEVASDYLLASLGISSWNIAVEIAAEEELYEGMVYSVSVVTDTQRPIELVFQ